MHRELLLLRMFSLILSWFYIDMRGEIPYYCLFKGIFQERAVLEINSRALGMPQESDESRPRRAMAKGYGRTQRSPKQNP